MDSESLDNIPILRSLVAIASPSISKGAWASFLDQCMGLGRITFSTLCLLVSAAPSAFCAPEKWPTHLWDPLIPKEHHYWHPPTIHFPIVMLLLEAGVLLLNARRHSEELSKASKYLLCLAGASFIPAVIAGLHDAGADLGKSNALLAGAEDRLKLLFSTDDALSVHVLFVITLISITLVRLVWRIFFFAAPSRARDLIFLISSLAGCWIVLATAQVGGSLSHP